MSLKDASAYNIQFHRGRPVLIDTLSFEAYREGEPWTAYRQFCQHFLAPLALMALVDVRLSQLLRGVHRRYPARSGRRLLPGRTRFDLGLSTHIHLHAAAQKRYADTTVDKTTATTARQMGRVAFLGLLDNLESTVRKLTWKPVGYGMGRLLRGVGLPLLERGLRTQEAGGSQLHRADCSPTSVWDLGANTGEFSRLASGRGIPTVAFDIDPAAVEQNYQMVKKAKEETLLPLVLDLTNPSPALGWHNRERMPVLARAASRGGAGAGTDPSPGDCQQRAAAAVSRSSSGRPGAGW